MSEASDRYPESLRDALPRGESYPLTRSEIDAALVSHDVERLDLIYFLRGGQRWTDDCGTVIDVHFRAVDAYPERLELRVFAIPQRLKSTVAAAITTETLDDVAEWIAAAGRAESPWRSTDHRLTLRWGEDALHREESDGMRARPY
jgi:hypothetical protein